jgi:LysR family transcriptional regulator, low CO2-responsive transcriptional regulator
MNYVHATCMEDVHQLKSFLAVAENLSFTRAAQSLFLTQSAVSHQIADLERSLGVELFIRHGRTIELTGAGRVLAERARRIFAELKDAQAAVLAAARPDLGRLRIGASAAACQYLIPESLREFRECFPSYSLSIMPGDSPMVAERVLDGSIDLGVMLKPEQRLKLTYFDLFEDELGFVVSSLHPWAKAGKVDRKELARQRMVFYSRTSATFRLVERFFVRMKTPLPDWIELGSMEAIKELIKLGLGVSMMAQWICRAELAQKSLVWLPIPGGRLARTWCIACQSGRKLSIAEQTFIGLCRDAAGRLA